MRASTLLRAFTALAALWLVILAACGGQSQCGAACRSSVLVRVRLPYGYAGLAGKSLDICRQGCLHVTFPFVEKSVLGTYPCQPSEMGGLCSVFETSVGTSQVEVEVANASSYANGDVYQITLRDDASGVAEIDAARTVKYVSHSVCGMTCPGATLTVWPGADASATCTGKRCDSGATLYASVPALPKEPNWHVRACRNDLCNVGLYTGMGPACTAYSSGIICSSTCDQADLPLAELTIQCGHPIKITMRVPALPEELSNGDVYSLRLEAGGVVFLDVSGVAKYSESLPNGATCDGVPCRFAKVTP